MRVITGTARGARLETLEGLETRPTTDRVKEAIYSSIQFEIEGRRVLDLFAGSGQLGIESLSRGAASAIFIDASAEAVAVIRQNLQHVKLADKASVSASDYGQFLGHTKAIFDVVFIDPPYSKGLAEKALALVAPHMSEQGVVIVETASIDELPETAGDFEMTQKKKYGKTVISYYRKKSAD